MSSQAIGANPAMLAHGRNRAPANHEKGPGRGLFIRAGGEGGIARDRGRPFVHTPCTPRN